MARLIDADALEDGKFHGAEDLTPIECALWQWGWNDAIDAIIDNAPTVDAVSVVRCKDCIHKPRGTRNKHDMEFPDEICPCQCDDYWYSWMPYDDWFCANGERREDETN